MKLQVSFFAAHRDIVGRDNIELDLPDGATVEDAAAAIGERYPRLFPLLRHSRAAVNEEYARGDAALAGGDHLVFIPPVSGG